jgi:transposase
MLTSERERRERLVIELYQEGKTYRDIAQTLRMSPNTMKAILSRAGLDQSTTESSRPYELFSEGFS